MHLPSFTCVCSLAAGLVVADLSGAAAQASNRDPAAARLVMSDIANFWRAIDRAANRDQPALTAALRSEYIAKASPGLEAFIELRLIDRDGVAQALAAIGWDDDRVRRGRAAPRGSKERAAFDSVVTPLLQQNAAQRLARMYLARRGYFDAIRSNTLALDTARAVRDSIRAAFHRMKALYPETTFPDVYFLMGRLSSGGTVAGSRLLIGTELYARDAATPIGELSEWERAVTGRTKDLPHIVAHELAHTLQASRSGPMTLLASALNEGSADFIAELISGQHAINPAYEYGDAHEAELWTEFRARMDKPNLRGWLYNAGAADDRPADLGYWIGYTITKAYYDRATDKNAAVREILRFTNPNAFLAASGYGKQ